MNDKAETTQQIISPLEQVLVDTIKDSTQVGGEIYDGIKSVTVKSIDFAQEQIPDIVEQLLLYNMIEAVLLAIFFFVVYIAINIFVWKASKDATCSFDRKMVRFLVFAFSSVGLLAPAMVNTFEALKIWIAPKLWLLDYATNLIQKIS